MSTPAPEPLAVTLPGKFCEGMTPQAKAELLVVLRVLAEAVIAEPDVQAWWQITAARKQDDAPPTFRPLTKDEVHARLSIEKDAARGIIRVVHSMIRQACAELNLEYPPLIAVLLHRYTQEWAVRRVGAFMNSAARRRPRIRVRRPQHHVRRYRRSRLGATS